MSRIIDIKPGDKILVCRTDRIGDLILALPFIETIKTRYPEIAVDVMASDYAAPVLDNNPHINSVFHVNRESLKNDNIYRRNLLAQLRNAKYRAAVALYPERYISFFLWKTGIPVRAGSGRRLHSLFFNRRLYHARNEATKHESAYNLDFLELFQSGPTIKMPHIYLQSAEIAAARELLGSKGIDGPFVVLHPGSGGSSENWPFANFLTLYSSLRQSGVVAILTGSGDELPLIKDHAGRVGIDPVSLAGETDLRMLAAVLSLAELAVANSTGPLHLAAAVGTKVVGLYPHRRVMAPLRWGPLGNGHIVLQPEKSTMGMNTIAVEYVLRAILALIKTPSTAGK